MFVQLFVISILCRSSGSSWRPWAYRGSADDRLTVFLPGFAISEVAGMTVLMVLGEYVGFQTNSMATKGS